MHKIDLDWITKYLFIRKLNIFLQTFNLKLFRFQKIFFKFLIRYCIIKYLKIAFNEQKLNLSEKFLIHALRVHQ